MKMAGWNRDLTVIKHRECEHIEVKMTKKKRRGEGGEERDVERT